MRFYVRQALTERVKEDSKTGISGWENLQGFKAYRRTQSWDIVGEDVFLTHQELLWNQVPADQR